MVPKSLVDIRPLYPDCDHRACFPLWDSLCPVSPPQLPLSHLGLPALPRLGQKATLPLLLRGDLDFPPAVP